LSAPIRLTVQFATIQPAVPNTRIIGNCFSWLVRFANATELVRLIVGMKHRQCRRITRRNGTGPALAAAGTARIATAPNNVITASTRSDAKNRSAIRPRKKGAMIAAIGLSVYARPMYPPIPISRMNGAVETYHAPQMKNSRNIMIDNRAITPRSDAGWASVCSFRAV
jgi:hypothetical protein